MKAGDTFYLKSKSVEGGHPIIVISDPSDGNVVIVNLTGWSDNKDQSCILEAGEDRVVAKRSIVSYRDAKIVAVETIAGYLESGDVIAGSPVSSSTIEKILYGCSITRRIPQGPYELLDQLGLIPLF